MPDITRAEANEPNDFSPMRLSNGVGFVDPEKDIDGGILVHLTNPASETGFAIVDGANDTIKASVAQSPLVGSVYEVAVRDRNAVDAIGAEITGNAYPAGGTGVRGGLSAIYKRLFDLIGDAVESPTANTLGDRLKAIYTRLADGSQLAKVGKVWTTTPSLAADQAAAYAMLDAYTQQRVSEDLGESLRPWQTRIRRVGSISTNQNTAVDITNGITVPTNAPPQDATYTVPAGKKFVLRRMQVTQLTKAGTDGVVGVLKVDAVIRHVVSSLASGTNQIDTRIGVVYPAGSVLTIAIGVTGGTIAGIVSYEGVEEPA